MKHKQLYNRVQHFLDRYLFSGYGHSHSLVFLSLHLRWLRIFPLAVQLFKFMVVEIGSTIGVSVSVFNIGTAAVAGTENIVVNVELRDPNGNLVTKSDGTPSRYIQALG